MRTDASESLSAAIEKLTDASESLGRAKKKLSDASVPLPIATEELSDSSDSLSEAIDKPTHRTNSPSAAIHEPTVAADPHSIELDKLTGASRSARRSRGFEQACLFRDFTRIEKPIDSCCTRLRRVYFCACPADPFSWSTTTPSVAMS